MEKIKSFLNEANLPHPHPCPKNNSLARPIASDRYGLAGPWKTRLFKHDQASVT